MSQLKEQWGNLMKTRSGGSHSPIKSAFVSTYKPTFTQHIPGITAVSDIVVKPEFEAFRTKIQTRMAELQSISSSLHKDAPATAVKQFIFGLNSQRAQATVSNPQPEKLSVSKPLEVKTIEQISKLQETDRVVESDAEQWEFEMSSVAHKSVLGPYVENPERDLTLTADLGPIARLAAAQRLEEVAAKMQGVEVDGSQLAEDRIEFADIANFAMGRLSRRRVLERFHIPQSTEKPSKVLSITIDTPQSTSSPVVAVGEKSVSPKETAHGKSKSVVPELFSRTQDSFVGVNRQQLEGEVEVKIAELMTSIRDSDGDNPERLSKLLEQFHRDAAAARSEHERLKARLLIQFLQEYQRVREARSSRSKKSSTKPAVPKVRRTPKDQTVPPPLDPSVYYYSPHNSGRAKASSGEHNFPATTSSGEQDAGSLVMRQGWSTGTRPAVLQAKYSPLKHDQPLSPITAGNKRSYANATAASSFKSTKKQQEGEPPTLWIGGTRHKDEFDDPNWVSPGEDSGKRKAQPRQTREKQGSGDSAPVRSITPM